MADDIAAAGAQDLSQALAARVREACERRTPLEIVGGGTKRFLGRPVQGERLDVSGHAGVVAYDPAELVITARAGEPLARVEALLADAGQMFAFEPPDFGPASTLGGVVAAGLAGPRRPFGGAVRDSLLGVRLLDGRGRICRIGGTVFKNVAGFDAFRPMAGALGTLGVLLDVSLRLAPRPPCETTLILDLPWPAARIRLNALMASPSPLSGAAHDGERLWLRLSGAPSAVERATRDLGGEPADPGIWSALRQMTHAPLSAPRLWRLNVPRTSSALDALPGVVLRDWAGGQVWLESDMAPDRVRAIAREAGGHATLFRGAREGEAVFEPLSAPLLALHQRLKAVCDPAGVLNSGRMYEEF